MSLTIYAMKKILFLSFCFIFILGCSKDSVNNNNPYLPTYRFSSSTINLNFPSYSQLLYAGNAIEYYEVGVGISSKIFILNTGSGYLAFDATCPNQAITSCSTMELNGIKAVCPCDEVEYSLYSGQAPNQQYPMLQYRVQIIDDTHIKVYN